ncbi:hypothetical protein NL317_30370, partial [Klebsiella pneumoniae]|nr:hypothetical protein [Klebsiella pneumoniae]
MKIKFELAATAAVIALAAGAAVAQPPPAAAPAAPPKTGPGPLPGWTTIGNGTWSVEGGEIVGVGGQGGSFL